MATSESDLKEQLADLDWGTGNAALAPEPVHAEEPASTPLSSDMDTPSSDMNLDLDVSVAGVKPPKARATKRGGRAAAVKRGPVAQSLVDAVVDGQTVASALPPGRTRRSRTTAPDVLTAAGESPAVLALFETMWKDVGSKLARSIGRPKASRQDAAIGWYALLLAMRERDSKR